MITSACAAGEDRARDLVESHAWHQRCPGYVFSEQEGRPEPCACSHHQMPAAPRRKGSLLAKARLVLAVALALLILWAWLR
jgi:hypothetical protein